MLRGGSSVCGMRGRRRVWGGGSGGGGGCGLGGGRGVDVRGGQVNDGT